MRAPFPRILLLDLDSTWTRRGQYLEALMAQMSPSKNAIRFISIHLSFSTTNRNTHLVLGGKHHTHTTKLAFAETVNPCNPCWGDGGLGRQFCECCFCDCSSPLLKILQRGIYNIFTTECASSRNCSLFYGGAHAPACVSKSSSHPKSYGETVKRMGP